MRIQENSPSQILTLVKPVGKAIPLRVGEIIEAQIVNLFPGGGLTLQVKDNYLPVRADLVFNVNDIISLKVLAQGKPGKEVILQLLDNKSLAVGNEARINPAPGGETDRIGNLVQKVLNQIFQLVTFKADGEVSQGSQAKLSSELKQVRGFLEDLVKALPPDSQFISREIKDQIQQILFTSSSLKDPGLKDPAGELILQLLKNKIGLGEEGRTKSLSGDDQARVEGLSHKALDQILNLIDQGKEEVPGLGTSTGRSVEVGKLRSLLGDLLKALPAEVQSLPRGLRTEIQLIFQAALKGLGQDVQPRIVQLMNSLPDGVSDPILIQTLKSSLVSMEGLQAGELQEALENSGVVLEAKIKALGEGLPQEGPGGVPVSNTAIKDLKAALLQIKELLQEKSNQDSPVGFVQRWLEGAKQNRGEEPRPYQKELGGVETLLKDVETFQLLSKVSDSFYTFLPVQWTELKRGQFILKRKRPPSGEAFYSCSIHMDLKRLGPVSVFIYMQQRDFFVTFKVDHPELNALIHSHLTDLKENFRQEGLNLKHFSAINDLEGFPDPSDRIDSDETLVSIRI
jgi:hypothetical protein